MGDESIEMCRSNIELLIYRQVLIEWVCCGQWCTQAEMGVGGGNFV